MVALAENMTGGTHLGSTYTKIGTIQRKSAWLVCKNDTQSHEAFHNFKKLLVINYVNNIKCKNYEKKL